MIIAETDYNWLVIQRKNTNYDHAFPHQVSAADIKKVKMSVEVLHSEKLKMEKAASKKAAAKSKGKASLRTESDVSLTKCFVVNSRPLFIILH